MGRVLGGSRALSYELVRVMLGRLKVAGIHLADASEEAEEGVDEFEHELRNAKNETAFRIGVKGFFFYINILSNPVSTGEHVSRRNTIIIVVKILLHVQLQPYLASSTRLSHQTTSTLT